MFSRLWAKFIISQLKKNAIKNESVLRVLIHYLLLAMQKEGNETLKITYSSDDLPIELMINCELMRKGGHNEKD